MNKTIGFIGAGNMASAMFKGIIKSGLVKPNQIIISDINKERLEALKEELGVEITTDAKEVATKSDIIIPSVKPHIQDSVLAEIKDIITDEKLVVSIAAGKTIESMETVLGSDVKIVRSMPNTPALVGAGMSSLSPNKNISEEELNEVKAVFDSFGESEVVPESLIHSVIGASGSSPAYVFMFIEAMADGAVQHGMPRDKAYKFAAQAVLGSAKMVLETGMHPGALKDMVCSPGGTTIEAVRSLEKHGFKSAVIEAMVDCMEKSEEMSKR